MPSNLQSDVWRHFVRSVDKSNAKCKYCSVELAYGGGTSNFRNHLKNKHPSMVASATPDVKKQVSMADFVSPQTARKLSTNDTERITNAITQMIVKDYVPLNIVEGEGFRELMSIVAPSYTVPCRNTIRSRIQQRYAIEKTTLTSVLEAVPSVAITTDTWTSKSTESYMTVTEHHIDDNWEMKTNVLMTRAMPERHTGENLAAKIQTCVKEYGLDDKVDTCVHDNARNMEKAGSMCEQWGDLGCFGHTLQLCIKPVLELPLVEKTTARCRKLIGHFKHSTMMMAELRRRQSLLKAPEHALIQDVLTRWNSTQLMLERLTEQRRVITDIMLDRSVTKKNDAALLLKDCEWDIVSDMSTVLSALTEVTTYMCFEKDVSCSDIYPIVCGLLSETLQRKTSDSGLVATVKDKLRSELTCRFEPDSEDTAKSTPVLAALLDPRFKNLPFLSVKQRKIAEDVLESRLDDVPLKVSVREPSQPAAKRRKLSFITYTTPTPNASDEMKSYLAAKMDSDANPLEWWKENESKFPKIAYVARQVLAVPATSVPSERIFSTAGLLINKLRNRLSSELVDGIIFLNKNRATLPEKD